MHVTRHAVLAGLALGLLLGATYAVYAPGLHGVFLLDDIPNLSPLSHALHVATFERLKLFVLSGNSGPLGRPLALASFLINDDAWPTDPALFKYTNVLFHLLTGCLLFWMALRLGRRRAPRSDAALVWPALLAVTFWLLQPFNVSTVLYVVQRMTELAALFVVAGLVCYLGGRNRVRAGRPVSGYLLMSVGIGAGGVLGTLCKESAVLLPVYVLAIEYGLFSHDGATRDRRWYAWAAIFLLLPITLLGGWLVTHISAGSYATRPFSLDQRLLTEARILVNYLSHILLPRRAGSGVFQDDFPVSHGILAPPSTLVCITLIVGSLAAALRYRRRAPLFAFAVFWFLGGHVLESSIVPLELYFEHRNYLPMFGPIYAVFMALYAARGAFARPLRGAAVVYVALAGFATWQNTTLWGNKPLQAIVWSEEHPHSVRAHQFAADLWLHIGRYDKAVQNIRSISQDYPRYASPYLTLLLIRCSQRHAVTADELGAARAGLAQAAPDPGTTNTLNKLIEAVKHKSCAGLTAPELGTFIDHLLATATKPRPGMLAALYYRRYQIYDLERNFSAALEALDASLRHTPNVDVALAKTYTLLSGGNIEQALAAVREARAMDRQSALGFPLRAGEINGWEQAIRQGQAQQRRSDLNAKR